MRLNPFKPPGEDPLKRGSDIAGADARKTFYWVEEFKGENVIYRLPQNVRLNDNVMIREDEFGVFFRDGKAMQVFDRPDRYALTTQTITGLEAVAGPLTGIVQIGELYWVQRREFRANFGSTEPLTFRDNEFGAVRLRVFGQFAYRVVEPLLLITQFVGTKGMTTSAEIVTWLKDQIVMVINDTLGELKARKQMGVLDIPGLLQEIEQVCLSKLNGETSQYGLQITKFSGLNVNLPEEVQSAVDKRSAMAALGVNYLQYQTGKAIEGVGIGAAQGGGDASGFAGLGAGMGAGYAMGQTMTGGMQPGQGSGMVPIGTVTQQPPASVPSQPAPSAPTQGVPCPKCGATVAPGSRFCNTCGAPLTTRCSKCQAEVAPGSRFCSSCGAPLT